MSWSKSSFGEQTAQGNCNPLVMECSICYERLHTQSTVLLPCDHVFHEDCILKWATRSPTCPNCRAEFWVPREPIQPIPAQPWWFWLFVLYGFWVYLSLLRPAVEKNGR